MAICDLDSPLIYVYTYDNDGNIATLSLVVVEELVGFLLPRTPCQQLQPVN